MDFDELVHFHILKHKASIYGHDIGIWDAKHDIVLRQLCAKVHPSLHDRLDVVSDVLGISKRQFIEASLLETITRAEEAITASRAFEQEPG